MDVVFKDKNGKRSRLELPCAEIVKQSPKSEQRAASSLVCGLLGIKGSPDGVAAA